MAKRMLVDATHPEETRVVVVSGNRLEELDFEIASRKQLKGNIYLAKVIRVEPSLQAAFVEYGGNRHGFLAFSEIHPDYYRIPVADREALLREQEEAAAEHEAQHEARQAAREAARAARATSDVLRAAPDEAGAFSGEGDAAHADAQPHDLSDPPPGAFPEGTPDIVVEPGAVPFPEDHRDVAGPTGLAPQVDNAPDIAASDWHRPVPPGPEGESPLAEHGIVAEPLIVDHAAIAEPEATAGYRYDQALDEHHHHDDEQHDREQHDFDPHGETLIAQDDDQAVDEGAEQIEPASGLPTDQPAAAESDAHDEVEEVRRRPRPLRSYKIQEVIKRRQILLVQVTKEERGNKGAALTTYLSLPGRYCVLMPNTPRGGGISRKITNPQDRKRLKDLLEDLDVPRGMAVILRTAGMERTKPEIKRDLEYLMRLWDSIREQTLQSVAPALIYEEANLIKRSIRDLYSNDLADVLVEGDAGYRTAKDFMRMLMPSHSKKVQPYKGDGIPLFHRYQVEGQIEAMFSPVVQLRSGGYIVINQTEALVAIDVNSGRATKERNIEETALRTNLEAAEEVARQLRLRDLAGLIVIDFIDMEDNRNNAAVERKVKESMKVDRARIQLGRISAFGLLELSRQRLRPSLQEINFERCPHCIGTGMIRSTESAALAVLRAIEEEGTRRRSAEITVAAATVVVLYILNQKRDALADIERRYRLRVYLHADDTLIAPAHRLERVKARSADEPVAAVSADQVFADSQRAFEEAEAAEAAEAEEDLDAEAEEAADADAEEAPDGEERQAGERGERDRGDRDHDGRRRRRRRRRRGDRPDGERGGERQREGHGERSEPRSAEAEYRHAEPGPDETGDESDGGEEFEGEVEAGTDSRPGLPTGGPGTDNGDRHHRKRRRGKRGGRRRGRRPDGEQGGELTGEPAFSEGADGADVEGDGGYEGGDEAGEAPYPAEPVDASALDPLGAPVDTPETVDAAEPEQRRPRRRRGEANAEAGDDPLAVRPRRPGRRRRSDDLAEPAAEIFAEAPADVHIDEPVDGAVSAEPPPPDDPDVAAAPEPRLAQEAPAPEPAAPETHPEPPPEPAGPPKKGWWNRLSRS